MSFPDRDLPFDFRLEFTFSAEIWPWRGPSPYHFITVPDDISAELHGLAPLLTYGWGVIPVAVLIGGTDFETSLFPKDGGYALPLKDAVRKAEDLADGDVVSVALSVRPPLPEPPAPPG
jgi:hypothetical protein